VTERISASTNRRLAWGMALACLACAGISAQDKKPVYSWDKAHEHVGETAIVEGRIVDSKKLENICFLNFHSDFRKYVSIVIFKEDFGKFPSSPEILYRGKSVRVTGAISTHKDRAQIKVAGPDQIEILPESATEATTQTASPASAAAGNRPVISWEDAADHYGEEVVAEGKIVATHNSGKVVHLNFHTNYRRYLTAVIFQRDWAKFPGKPEEIYANQTVRVRGVVKKYQDAPEIIVNDPGQIEVIEPRLRP